MEGNKNKKKQPFLSYHPFFFFQLSDLDTIIKKECQIFEKEEKEKLDLQRKDGLRKKRRNQGE